MISVDDYFKFTSQFIKTIKKIQSMHFFLFFEYILRLINEKFLPV